MHHRHEVEPRPAPPPRQAHTPVCAGSHISMCMHRGLSPEPTYCRYLDVICVALPLPPVCADSYTLVFHEPMDACKFCLQVRAAAAVQGGRQGGRQARRKGRGKGGWEWQEGSKK